MRTDDQLWTEFQAGNDDAWSQLLNRHWAAVVTYTTMRTGNPAIARMVVRDALRRIYKRRHHNPQAFKNWVYTLAHFISQPYWSAEFLADIAETDRLCA